MRSMKTKVAAATTLGIISVMAIGLVAQLYLVRSEMIRVLEAQQLSLVSRVGEEIDDKIQIRLEALERLAKTLRVESGAGTIRLQEILADRPAMQSLFDTLSIVGIDGVPLALYPPHARMDAIQVGDRRWFIAALAATAPLVSAPVKSRLDGSPVLILSAPIRDAAGRVAGVLSGSLDLFKPNFIGHIGAAKIGSTGSFSIISRERSVIMSHDPARLLTQAAAPGVSPVLDRALGQAQGSEINAEAGELHGLVSYKALASVPWVIAASLPLEEAFAPITLARNKILLVMGLVALLVLPVAWFAMRRLLAPLGQLHEAMRINREHPEQAAVVAIDTPDEIGELARNFNTLTRERAHADEQVRQRTRELEQSNRELDAFSHTVAHDMRAPLRHIESFGRELQRSAAAKLDAEENDFIDRMIAAAHLQSEMIDGMLQYASFQQKDLELVPVDLGRVLHELIAEIQSSKDARAGTVWQIGDLPAVLGDEVLLRHLFGNLVDNAVKYSSKREQPVIGIGWNAQGASQAKIYVRDNGDGFEMRYADKLFGMFQRLHTKREFPGTGIGLALVRRIAERLNGSVEAAGEVGKGATFSVVLNLA